MRFGAAARTLAVFAATAGFSLPALAWDTIGHEAVALVAERLLSPAVHTKVEQILASQDDPDGPATMVEAAPWADRLKHFTHQYDSWHLMDGSVDRPALRWPEDCGPQGCVVQAIRDNEAALRDPAVAPSAKAIALRYLIHLAADANDPIAVADRDDQHGAKTFVEVDGSITDLHRLWDKDLVEGIDLSSANLAEKLVADIGPGRRAQWAADPDPLTWATESFAIARRVYAQIPTGKTNAGTPAVLDPVATDLFQQEVREQLEKSGVRLAAMLEQIFAPAEASRRRVNPAG